MNGNAKALVKQGSFEGVLTEHSLTVKEAE